MGRILVDLQQEINAKSLESNNSGNSHWVIQDLFITRRQHSLHRLHENLGNWGIWCHCSGCLHCCKHKPDFRALSLVERHTGFKSNQIYEGHRYLTLMEVEKSPLQSWWIAVKEKWSWHWCPSHAFPEILHSDAFKIWTSHLHESSKQPLVSEELFRSRLCHEQRECRRL